MYGLGGATILSGLVGVLGSLKKNRCLLAIFNILNILLCAIFVGIGVAVVFFSNSQYSDLKN